MQLLIITVLLLLRAKKLNLQFKLFKSMRIFSFLKTSLRMLVAYQVLEFWSINKVHLPTIIKEK